MIREWRTGQAGLAALVAVVTVWSTVGGCDRANPHGRWSTPAGHATVRSTDPSERNPEDAGLTTRPAGQQASLFRPVPETSGAVDETPVRVGICLDILRVEVPLGAVSGSYELWNHLDEQALGAEQIVTLKRNGLRAGVGRAEAWQPIKTFLDGIDDHFVYHQSTPLSTGVLSLDLTNGPDDQEVFWFGKNGEMAGRSFPGSRNVLQVIYRMSPADPGGLILKVIPEIRRHRRKMEWTRRGKQFLPVPVYYGRTFHELVVETALPAGRFLAIGPGREIDLARIIGRALLTREVEGKRYESIYFLTPNVIRSASSSDRPAREP